jgi:hypothetical protein
MQIFACPRLATVDGRKVRQDHWQLHNQHGTFRALGSIQYDCDRLIGPKRWKCWRRNFIRRRENYLTLGVGSARLRCSVRRPSYPAVDNGIGFMSHRSSPHFSGWVREYTGRATHPAKDSEDFTCPKAESPQIYSPLPLPSHRPPYLSLVERSQKATSSSAESTS